MGTSSGEVTTTLRMPLLSDSIEWLHHPLCVQALYMQLQPPAFPLTLSPSALPPFFSPASSQPEPPGDPGEGQPFCTASPVRLADARGTMDFWRIPFFPAASQKLGAASEDAVFGPGTGSPNKSIFCGCWEGDNCFHLANVRCQHQCFLSEANVWLRRQCQAKYFLCIKIPLIF